MGKFKVGDRVVIRDLYYYKDIHDIGVNVSMSEMSGEVCTISGVFCSWITGIDLYRLKEDNGKWVWADDMFEYCIKNKDCKFMKRGEN